MPTQLSALMRQDNIPSNFKVCFSQPASSIAAAQNQYSAAGASVEMNNTVGDGASSTVGNYDNNASTPAGHTNFLDAVDGGAVPTNIESSNWSGAVITAASGESFSTVSATWVVPTVSQVPITGVTNSDVAEWVGIDGYNSADVCQAGVLEIVQTSPTVRQRSVLRHLSNGIRPKPTSSLLHPSR